LAGELVKEGDLNAQIRDNMNVLKTPMNDDGKIIAIDSLRFDDLSGENITGVAQLASANTFTDGTQDFNGGANTRVVLPVGTDKWVT
jgi:hypothetical protein